MADKGGRGVVEVLTTADEGGRGGLDPPFLADIIFEQPLSLTCSCCQQLKVSLYRKQFSHENIVKF